MTSKLSVIVPIFNVEPYLPGLLKSLSSQELHDIEFVLVDDGSHDRSLDIAKKWTKQDRRFTLITQENRGLSTARNIGVLNASGQYLAFADADDVVPSPAYRTLVESLERSGSDFASGDVRRLTSAGITAFDGYADAFVNTQHRTHISAHEALITDRMVWNKVFRRSFWDENGFEFQLTQYEDAPITMHAHIVASAVDVIAEVVYLWRIRENGEPSITQRLYEPENLRARMRMVVDTAEVIETLAPYLSSAYARDALVGDISIAILATKCNSTEALGDAIDLARHFIDSVDPAVLHALEPGYRHRLHLLAADRIDDLRVELLADDQRAEPFIRRQ